MKAPRVCVAGLRTDGGGHLRPVTGAANPLTRSMLRSEGGLFALGTKVDLGKLTPRPSPPEVEDHLFRPAGARSIGVIEPDEYLKMIDSACEEDFETIFGPNLTRDGWGLSLPEGEGAASLGCLRVSPGEHPQVSVDYGKVTIRLRRPEKPFYFTVTDIRCYEADQKTPVNRIVEAVQHRLDRGVPLRLMVGLGHAWTPDDEPPRHWLQVNGLCLEDSPLGSVP